MNAFILIVILLNMGLLLTMGQQITTMEISLVEQIAQPIPTAPRDTTQDILILHDDYKGQFKMSCALLVLPYEHQGPIDGEILPNRTMQMECEVKGVTDNNQLRTTDPYFKAIEAQDDADQT